SSDGHLYVAGGHLGRIDLGGGPKLSVNPNCYLAKLTENGTYRWALFFGDSATPSGNVASCYGVARDSQNNVVVTGMFNGRVDFGGGALTSSGLNDIFVAKFTQEGKHLWSRQYGSADSED